MNAKNRFVIVLQLTWYHILTYFIFTKPNSQLPFLAWDFGNHSWTKLLDLIPLSICMRTNLGLELFYLN